MKLSDYGIRTNVHFVLDAHSVDTAFAWLNSPPGFLHGVNAIVFLNYKPVGRGARHDRLLRHSNAFRSLIDVATSAQLGFKVGFDSCMVSGLVAAGSVNPIWYDACEAARFTMFVSEDLQAYPCSFMETIDAGICLRDNPLLDVWRKGKSFRATRQVLRNPRCGLCSELMVCRGGCPVFPQINLCDASISTEKGGMV